MLPLIKYASLVFDCDGVLLDSNRLKTEAFGAVARPFGDEAAASLVAHHVANGGVSRQEKFAWLAAELEIEGPVDGWVAERCREFAAEVERQLAECPAAERLTELRHAMPPAQSWFIVSGGAQEELVRVFERRGRAAHFDGGIFGNPKSKDQLLGELRATGRLGEPALYLGDSRYDAEVSRQFGLDFLFVSGWTEVEGWQAFCAEHDLPSVTSVDDLTAAVLAGMESEM